MPFTLAHPAIVLPFGYLPRKWISMTALVFGSLMPDAESYLRTYALKEITHSWIGFFLFGLPLGLLLTLIFHNLVRNQLINNLPLFLYQRFSRFKEFDWNKRVLKDWPVVVVSMILGGVSHFFWDGFSHLDSLLVTSFPRLGGHIHWFDTELEIIYLIQYASTFLGIAFILGFVRLMPRVTKPRNEPVSSKFWMSVLLISVIILILRRLAMPINSLDDMLVAILSALAFSVILTSLLIKPKSPAATP